MLQVDSSPTNTTELELRRFQALGVAELCIQLLKDMGATEVFVCGSLSGETPWHWHSDLDLVILGLSQDRVWDAYTAVENLTPDWLEVDLKGKRLKGKMINFLFMQEV